MFDSFILGVSTGSVCVATCGIVLFPYLMSGAASTKRIILDVSVFLATRLFIYFILASLSWYFGQKLFSHTFIKTTVPGMLYMVLSSMLMYYSISKSRKANCPAKMLSAISNKKLIPILLGIVNSIGLCPALFIVITKGATQNSLMQSYLAFTAFFIGSSVWFLPLPFVGKIKKLEILKTIGILATGLAGLIFMIKGITLLIGGI